jgi:uncharacterized protein (DUF1501 family)
LRRWRAELVAPAPGTPEGLHDLDGFWGLHPTLVHLRDIYRAGELLPFQAVAWPNRSRSHFEAQDTMEMGAAYRMASGWLNRTAGLIPPVANGENAIAISDALPLILRGPVPVATWAPPIRRSPDMHFYAQLAALHAGDALTAPVVAAGLRERGFTDAVLSGQDQAPQQQGEFSRLAHAAGLLLAAENGPRLAVLETGGDWDTHDGQVGRLSRSLASLDEGLAALKVGLGLAWNGTVVLVVSEFGRTVRVNGTHGTDHGTGSMALALGGAVAGGRVTADWPGLGEKQLFEGRDLQPTMDLRGVLKGLLADHLGFATPALAQIFPGSEAVPLVGGLVRS